MIHMKKNIRIAVILFAFLLVLFGAACYIHAAIDKQQQIKEVYGTKEFYSYRNERSKLPERASEVSFIAVGDLSYSRGVQGIIKQKNDVDYPLKAISELIRGSDIAFANLETPLTEGAEIPINSMLFRSDPDTAYALSRAGFSVVSLANNHSMNFGGKGLSDTVAALSSAGIRFTGAGVNNKEAYMPVYIEKSGIRFALLAYVDPSLVPDSYEAAPSFSGVALMKHDLMKDGIKKAKRNADFVIVFMHAGIEYSNSAGVRQKEFARAAIDAGADLVIGQHPHAVQPVEKYHGKYIFYSLGNFVFDQYRSKNTREELMIKVYFSKKKINKILILPLFAEKFAQPRIATGDERNSILKKIKLSTAMQDVYYCSGSFHFIRQTRNVIYANNENRAGNVSKTTYDDLDGDSVPEEYSLKDGCLSIAAGSATVWESPLSWWIDDFVLADSNNDGVTDINLSLWKAGDYGKHMPFWVKENDMSIKNHFFILDYSKGRVRHVWCSSNLSQPNCEFQFADINNDLKKELIVIEGNYSQVEGDYSPASGNRGLYIAVWSWNGWGFSNEWRSEKGNYMNLTIEKSDNKLFIVSDNIE